MRVRARKDEIVSWIGGFNEFGSLGGRCQSWWQSCVVKVGIDFYTALDWVS